MSQNNKSVAAVLFTLIAVALLFQFLKTQVQGRRSQEAVLEAPLQTHWPAPSPHRRRAGRDIIKAIQAGNGNHRQLITAAQVIARVGQPDEVHDSHTPSGKATGGKNYEYYCREGRVGVSLVPEAMLSRTGKAIGRKERLVVFTIGGPAL